jgi:arylsulfatase A-like enzyme
MTFGSPRDKWPLGRGFERYYGFMGGETDQYHPDLVYDNHPVDPPRTPEEGYHLTEDLADKAILFLKDLRAIAPSKPFFLWFPPGACHAPHQAPADAIAPTAASSIRAGTAGGRRCSRARWPRACCRRGPSCRRGPRGCPPGIRSRMRSGDSTRA